MEEQDAAADPYLPYDGGGDTIPLQEIPRKGTPHVPDGPRVSRPVLRSVHGAARPDAPLLWA